MLHLREGIAVIRNLSCSLGACRLIDQVGRARRHGCTGPYSREGNLAPVGLADGDVPVIVQIGPVLQNPEDKTVLSKTGSPV